MGNISELLCLLSDSSYISTYLIFSIPFLSWLSLNVLKKKVADYVDKIDEVIFLSFHFHWVIRFITQRLLHTSSFLYYSLPFPSWLSLDIQKKKRLRAKKSEECYSNYLIFVWFVGVCRKACVVSVKMYSMTILFTLLRQIEANTQPKNGERREWI